MTAALERARKGVTFFVQRPGSPLPDPPNLTGKSGRWTPSGGGGRQFLFEIWEFLLPKDFNFSSAQLSTSLQCRKKERAVSMWQDLPTSGKMEFVEPLRGHFSILGWGTFPPMEVQQKGIEATRP